MAGEQKPVTDGGTENADKMKALGLSSMPEDGQEGLDKMYAEKQKTRPKYQRMYKD